MPSSEALHLVKALVLIQATARKLPDEKHPSSGKTSFSPPSKLKLLAAWATSIAGVASMVQRQPPDASILLTSMDHLSGSVIVVGSLSGKSLEFADPLIPQGRLHPADDILSYSTFPSCMDQMPCMQDLSGPAVSLGSSTPPYRVPAFQAYLTDGRCKKKKPHRRVFYYGMHGQSSTQHLQHADTTHGDNTLAPHPYSSFLDLGYDNETKPTFKRQAVCHLPVTHRLLQCDQRRSSHSLDRTKLPQCLRQAAFNGNGGRGWWKNGFLKSSSSTNVGRGGSTCPDGVGQTPGERRHGGETDE
ncbi:hypothetical protein BKA70DRAFT_795617 [Coprinopsis sp. MPI-PUGE-AT-0042]|nr:hypothetical protein BKA70DRAFT_795617 [Coprinopsis sp. MPI-PUGE-AT-0042]